MAVTMREIAEVVGVSIPTVSRVLRDVADVMVNDATRKRIFEVADELGYHPNPHAQALARGKASSIAVLAPTSPHAVNSVKTWTLCNTLAEFGRDMLVVGVDPSSSKSRIETMLYAAVPEAVVILTSGWEIAELQSLCRELHAREIWPLLVDPIQWGATTELASDVVVLNRAQGAFLAVSHLADCGHRRIGLLTPSAAEARAVGYKQALRARGITDHCTEILTKAGSAALVGEHGAERLLRRHPEVTALFCYSDLTALGALKGIERMGLRVPEDVAVVGFDDQPWTAYLPVPLTTVAQPVQEMCQVAAQLLRSRLGGDTGPWQRVDISPRLVVRASTG